jgi:hypothetical protein
MTTWQTAPVRPAVAQHATMADMNCAKHFESMIIRQKVFQRGSMQICCVNLRGAAPAPCPRLTSQVTSRGIIVTMPRTPLDSALIRPPYPVPS